MKFTLLLWIISLPLLAQTVSGVVTSANGEPLPGATVYFDGTTIGDYTDETGKFELINPTPGRENVLVVSYVGYQTTTLMAGDRSAPYPIVLEADAAELPALEVKDANLRAQTLAEFRAIFLGVDDWGRNARIRNEDVLRFDRDRRQRSVKVSGTSFRRRLLEFPRQDMVWNEDSSQIAFTENTSLFLTRPAPLELELPDLGYRLRAELLAFRFDRVTGTTSYLGRFFFQPEEGTGEKPRKRHRRNRERAYYGSPLHFVRSLVGGRLAENGFSVLRRTKTESGEQVEPYDLGTHLRCNGEGDCTLGGIGEEVFTILYCHDSRGRPLPVARRKQALTKQSVMMLVGEEALLRTDGSQADNHLQFGGWMAQRGAAWLLPTDWGG